MTSIVVLVLILFLGFLIFNSILKKILIKINLTDGLEYLFLGILLSPSLSDWINASFLLVIPKIISFNILEQLQPLITASVGFIGLTYGLKFNLGEIHKRSAESIKLGVYSVITSLIIVGAISFGLFFYFFGSYISIKILVITSLAIGVIGGVSSNQVIRYLYNKYSISGNIALTIKHASLLNINISILVFGLLFGIIHPFETYIKITSTEYILISLSIAFIIGLSFYIFISREESQKFLVTSVIGIVVLTSGMAHFLASSSLFMCFIIGLILSNLSKQRERISEALDKLMPLFIAFTLLVTGIYWAAPSVLLSLLAISLFFVLKIISGRISSLWVYSISYDKTNITNSIYKGMISVDIIASCMMLDYIRVFNNPLTVYLIVVVTLSLFVFNALGYITAKNYLVDVGEITKETV